MEKTEYSKIRDYEELSREITHLQVRIEERKKRLWIPFVLAAIRSLKAFLTK